MTPWTAARQAPLSMGFSRQEYWSGLPFPAPADLPDPELESRSPTSRADSLPFEPPVKVKGKALSRVRLFATPWLYSPWNSPGQNSGVGSLFPSPGDLPNPGIKPRSPTLQADSLPAEPQGKPQNTGVGSISLLQGIFSTQESNWALLHCREILYQLSHGGRP